MTISVKRVTVTIVGVLLEATMSCAPAPESVATVLVRDSAGVSITELPAQVAGTQVLAARGEPLLRIGATGPGYDLFGVREVKRLADGRIAVLNGGANQVLLFDGSGSLALTVGESGEGPGEFLAAIFFGFLPSDSILITDFRSQTGAVFTAAGEVSRTFGLERPATPPPFTFPIGLATNRLFAQQGETPIGPLTEPGSSSTPVRIHVFDLAGVLLDSWASVGTTEYLIVEIDGRLVPVQPPLGAETFLDVTTGHLAVATSSEYEVRYYDPDGRIASILRRDWPRFELGNAVAAAVRDEWIEAAPSTQGSERRRAIVSQLALPQYMPPIRALLIDSDGRTWIGIRTPEWDAPRLWHVYDEDGSMSAIVRTPPGFELRSASSDYVLGVVTNQFGEESIVGYRLRVIF